MVAVAGQPVGAERAVDFGEVRGEFESAPCAGDARLGVDHRAPVEPARFGERGEREDGRGRVAAGHSHQPRFADRVAVQLGQPVDGVGEQLGRGVLAVPLLVALELVEAEVGAGVDDGDAVADVAGQPLGGGGVRQRGEDHIHLALDLGDDRQIERPEVGEDFGQPLAGFGAPGDADDLEIRVLREQPRQLSADVARDVDDRRANHAIHRFLSPIAPSSRRKGDHTSRAGDSLRA